MALADVCLRVVDEFEVRVQGVGFVVGRDRQVLVAQKALVEEFLRDRVVEQTTGAVRVDVLQDADDIEVEAREDDLFEKALLLTMS